MSISSSLAAGVSGLNANSQRLAGISDNIANASTDGYKRVVSEFHSMVLGSGSDSKYTAGGVRSTSHRVIDQRGQIAGSENPTDIALDGRGFLPIANRAQAEVPGGGGLLLTTTGSFRPGKDGFLVNASGNVLLGWPAAADGTFPAVPRDTPAALQGVNIFHNQFAASPTKQMDAVVNLPSGAAGPDGTGEPEDLSIEYYGNLGQSETLTLKYTPTANANEWTLTIADSASDPDPARTYTLTFSDTAADGGKLQNVTRVNGGNYDVDDGTIEVTTGGGTISLFIGGQNNANGTTQLGDLFSPVRISKDGASIGNMVGVDVGRDGIVSAVYDTGFTRAIFRVPVVDVPNPNGLTPDDDQTYRVSLDSGPMFLWDAGQGPVGETLGFAREASTVDVARELTDLIQTQRAYSSNAKVIQTVDEMLQETTNLKR